MLAVTRQGFQFSGSSPCSNLMTTAITCCKTIRRWMQTRRKARVAAGEPQTMLGRPTCSSSRSRRRIHLVHLEAVLCGSSTRTCGKTTTIPWPPPSAITKMNDLVEMMERRPLRKETSSSAKLSAIIRAP